MARRSVNWHDGLAQDLRDPEFASEFIGGLLEQGETLKNALAMTIKAYGVTEFAEVAGIAESNIHRTLSEKSNPTEQTLEALLAPFGLTLGINKRAHSA